MSHTLVPKSERLGYKSNKLQDVHEKNCKSLMKKIKKELSKWKIFHVIDRKTQIVKISVLSNFIHLTKSQSIKILVNYFVYTHKLILKFI